MKRGIVICLALALFCQCLLGAALAEAAQPRFASSQAVTAYLDEEGISYRLDTSTEEDVFIRVFAPNEAEGIESIVIGAYVDDEGVDIMTGNLVLADTSDMLKLYQGLEAVNEGAAFVRFIYTPSDGGIYARMELPYVDDGNFGRVVERYMFIAGRTVDQNYNALAALA